ncbi:MAG: hypothetical protein V3S82_10280 [Dehalococcoidia bacterium]
MGRPSSGYYREGDKRTPRNRKASVTTVLKLWGDKGGLLYWANEQGLEGKNLQEARETTGVHAGNQAHAWVEADLNGQPGAMVTTMSDNLSDEDLVAARAGFQAYEDWKAGLRGFRALETELPLVHPTLDYGGTLDCVAAIMRPPRTGDQTPRQTTSRGMGARPWADQQVLILADWKLTGGTYAEHVYQGAAYLNLYEATHPGERIEEFHALRFGKPTKDGLSKGGDFHHHRFTRAQMDVAFEAFVHILEAYKINKSVERWVR